MEFFGAPCVACRVTAMHRQTPVPSAPGNCFYCGEYREALVLDHVVPLARGGTYDPWNLVRSCSSCNSKKSDMIPSEWCPNNAGAIEIERRSNKILPRMRKGRMLDNRATVYVNVLALCTGFVDGIKEQVNSISGGDPVARKALTLWNKVNQLRIHLWDHPVVVEATKPISEK